ncbi:vacuolar membrane protein-domain-containing protein [Lipomyces kononenkoae]|uniref:Vacuolar membrane protein-domain-containing protein n=1 Tax=Lipomyces kononenkoae TaxID=34357 RepID=A0ACC3TC72_LIPKO
MEVDNNQCQLLGPFALLVQGAMGGLALLSLVYKRYHEHPRRPVIVWMFDVSKQVMGAGGIHMVNIFLAILSSSQEAEASSNPCNWYFLNILLDTTIGVPILWFFLSMIGKLVLQVGIVGARSGEYGHPPKFSWFFKQAVIYFLGLSCMKFVVYVLLAVLPFWDELAGFLLTWTRGHDKMEVSFVMLFFPLIMNMVQYYLVDSIIKSHDRKIGSPRSPSVESISDTESLNESTMSTSNYRFRDDPAADDAILVERRTD